MSEKKNRSFNSSDEKNAESFFRSKLKKNYHKTIKDKDTKFRDLDEESVKLTKLKARINFLKNNKDIKDDDFKTNIDDILSSEVKQNVIFKSKNVDETSKTILKGCKRRSEDRVKNLDDKFDEFGNIIKCFCVNNLSKTQSKYIVLKSFEINSQLYKFGKSIEISENVISFLLKNNLIRKLNKYEISKESNKPFHVKKTFGLSELKKSSLINKKKLNE